MNGTAKTCEVVTDFRRLEQLSTDWVRLWEASSRREIFQDLGWIRAFWKAYGHKVSLCSPVVFNGEEVIGILPLVVQGDTLQFLGTPRSDYNDILCEDYLAADVLGIALEALLELPNRWKNCTLANLSGESLIVRHLRELPNQVRRHVELIFGCSCPDRSRL